MSYLKNKHISVHEFQDKDDYRSADLASIPEELIEINSFNESDATELEEEGFFHAPNYITYMRRSVDTETLLNELTRNKRKKVKKGLKHLEAFTLTYECPISDATYRNWFSLYEESLDEKEYGILLTRKSWAVERYEQGVTTAGIFVWDGDEIVCGINARSYEENEQFPERLSISFSAIKQSLRSSDINDAVNALMIAYASELGYAWVSRGRDINFYGRHLSSGIPIFKTSFGYEIIPVRKMDDMLIAILRPQSFTGSLFFVSHDKDLKRLVGNLILSDDADQKDTKAYLLEQFSKLRVFSKKEDGLRLLETHRPESS